MTRPSTRSTTRSTPSSSVKSGHGGQLHLHADLQVGGQRALDHLAQHDQSLVGQLDRGDGERLEGIRGG